LKVPGITPLQDPSVYPRVYRASGGWLIALILCGSVLALGGIFGTWFLANATLRNLQSRFWLVGLCLAFGALGIYCLLSTFRSRVVLFADRIEVEELTRTAVLSRDEVRGWRSLPTSPPGFVFIPRDASRRPVKVAQVFRLDPEFAEWLYTLPCLDNEDARTSKAEIRTNTRLGATPGERMKTLAKGKRLARILNVIASLAALWGFVYPRPYEPVVLVLAALPWIAVEIVRRSGGLFRVDANRNDAHPNVAIAFIFPGMVLGLRSVLDYDIVYSLAVVWFTIGIGGLLCLSAIAVDPSLRGKVGTIAGLLVLSLAYGYGTVIEANALLDHSPEASYIANVEGKRIVKGQTTTYELDLGAWGPKTKLNKLRVTRATYNAVEGGDVVYLTLKQGALGVNWYFMRQWQRGDHPMATPISPLQQ
jgi:hypothetical protein